MDDLTSNATSTPLVFECEYCHDAVDTAISPPSCYGCGTRYRFDDRKNIFTAITSRAQVFDFLAVLFLLTGIGLLAGTETHHTAGWFFAFIGFAFHYGNGLRNGVLSTRFFVLKHAWTIYRVESPHAFDIAALVEGLSGLFLLLAFLLSL